MEALILSQFKENLQLSLNDWVDLHVTVSELTESAIIKLFSACGTRKAQKSSMICRPFIYNDYNMASCFTKALYFPVG